MCTPIALSSEATLQIQSFPSLSALPQWLLGPQILLLILLADRIHAQQLLYQPRSRIDGLGSCPLVFSRLSGGIVESAHIACRSASLELSRGWRAPVLALSFHLGTPAVCCHTINSQLRNGSLPMWRASFRDPQIICCSQEDIFRVANCLRIVLNRGTSLRPHPPRWWTGSCTAECEYACFPTICSGSGLSSLTAPVALVYFLDQTL